MSFTHNVQRHVPGPPARLARRTVREVLDAVFAETPPARGYFLDDQGGLRRHIEVFVNGEPVKDRAALTDPLPEVADVFVMQALSGGDPRRSARSGLRAASTRARRRATLPLPSIQPCRMLLT